MLSTSFVRLSIKPVEKPKELIIPLIQRNRWCSRQENRAGLVQGHGDGGGVKAKTQPPSQEQDSVESQAVKEIIEGLCSSASVTTSVKIASEKLS